MPVYKGTTIVNTPLKGTAQIKIYKGSALVHALLNINFDETGGASVSNKTAYYLSTYGTLPTTTKTYYSFNGWYTAASGGSVVSSGTTVTQTIDHTLYAHWNYAPVSPTVTYVSNTSSSLTFNISNPNPYTVSVYYEVSDSTPDAAYVSLASGANTNVTVSGLSGGTYYYTYFRCYVSGVYSSVISKYYSTLASTPTNWVLLGFGDANTYSYNSAVSYSHGYTTCRTSDAVDTWVTTNYPPGGYTAGHVIRVYETKKLGVICGYYFFTATV